MQGGLSLFKNFTVQSFFLSFMAGGKNWPVFILCEKYRMSSCTTNLISNKDNRTINLIVFLGSWSIIAWISPRNSGLLLSKRTFQAVVPSHPSLNWANFFESSALSSDWHANTEIFVLCFQRECHAVQRMHFLNTRRSELLHGDAFLLDCAQLTVVCFTVEKLETNQAHVRNY